MAEGNGAVDVTRREYDDIAKMAREHDRELGTLAEWRKHRDQSLDGIFATLREIQTALAPIAKAVEAQAGGIIDTNNRVTSLNTELQTTKAEVKINTEARQELATQLKTISGLVKWLIALAPLVGIAVGILTFYGMNHKPK